MTAAPLAVWDVNDPDNLFWQHWPQTTTWAQEHLPDQANYIHRVEFHQAEVPFAVIHEYDRTETGRKYCDLATGEPVTLPPRTVALSELPPTHLLTCADAISHAVADRP